jgi:S1-C subfamily serine protease
MNSAIQVNQQYIDNRQNLTHLTNSIVALVKERPLGGTRPICSAFFVDRNLIATASHCLSTPNLNSVFTIDLPPHIGQEVLFSTYSQWKNSGVIRSVGFYRSEVVAFDVEHDVGLLRTINFTSNDYLVIDQSVPLTGTRVYNIGLPGGLPWVLSEGIVSGTEFDDDNNLSAIISSTPIFYGSSGSALVSNDGYAIGITRSMHLGQSNFAVYTPIRHLVNLRGSQLRIHQK